MQVYRIERKQDNGRYRAIPGLVYASGKTARTALRRICQQSNLKLRVSVTGVRHA